MRISRKLPMSFQIAGTLFREIRLVVLFFAMVLFMYNGCGEKATEQLKKPFTSKTKKVSNETPQPTPVQEVKGVKDDETYVYRVEGRRDPFKSLLLGLREKKTAGMTPLQQRSLGELRVIGIVWGAKNYMGMIETPDGKGFLIKEGTFVGPDGGVVKRITEDSIIIEEIHTDFYGKKVSKTTVLRLRGREEGGG